MLRHTSDQINQNLWGWDPSVQVFPQCSQHTQPLPWAFMPVWMLHCSVMSESVWPFGLQPARLLCPWDSPGENTGVGCRFLLKGIFLTRGSNRSLLCHLHCRQILYGWATGEACALCVSTQWILAALLEERCGFCFHFMGEKMQAQPSPMLSARSRGWWVAGCGFEPRPSGSRVHALSQQVHLFLWHGKHKFLAKPRAAKWPQSQEWRPCNYFLGSQVKDLPKPAQVYN